MSSISGPRWIRAWMAIFTAILRVRSLLALVLTACGPTPPGDGATAGDTHSSAATTTGMATTTGVNDDNDDATSVDPTIGKLDLSPEGDLPPPPPPPACDPPPEVPPDAHCEVLQHSRSWDFMYACLEGADPDACPDAAAAAVLDLLNDCSLCVFVRGDVLCGPDPRREDACCYWGFDVVQACPFP